MKKNKKGIIIIIEGPSGVGKDTIVQELIKKHPNTFAKVPSMTTRPMRENESQGNPYFFVDEKTFNEYIATGKVFEHTIRHGQYRGMSTALFDEVLAKQLFPIKDCDKVGLDALKNVYGDKVHSIFITCPKEEIKKRLIGRGDSGEDLQARLDNYDEYIKNAVYYDEIVENIDLDVAVDNIYNKIMNFYKKCK